MRLRKVAIALFTVAATAAMAGHDGGQVRQAQEALNQKGFDAGTADGKWGPQTQAAVQKFQQSQKLEQSGELDNQTLAALNVQAASGFGPRPQSSEPAPAANAPAPAANASGAQTSGASGSQQQKN